MAACVRAVLEAWSCFYTQQRLNQSLTDALLHYPSIPPDVSINGRVSTLLLPLFHHPPTVAQEHASPQTKEKQSSTHDGVPSEQRGAPQEATTNKDDKNPSLREQRG